MYWIRCTADGSEVCCSSPLVVLFCLQLIEAGPDSDAWIAARFVGPMQGIFHLGDGSNPGNGRFFNRPLTRGLLYRVFVRAYTADNVS